MNPETLIEKELTASIIGAFYEVYNTLRYGFREHLYVRRWSGSYVREVMP